MNDNKPKIFVIGGPNGSGKTTSAKTLLPELLECHEFVNADSVAAALSPFNPDAVAIQAGRLMLERIKYLAERSVTFAFETTLASRTFLNFLTKCKDMGYEINILYLWLQNAEIAITRVKSRVEQGGHDIPKDVIVRRYHSSIKNFLNEYVEVANNWALYDNSEKHSELVAYKTNDSSLNIIDDSIWAQIKRGMQHDN